MNNSTRNIPSPQDRQRALDVLEYRIGAVYIGDRALQYKLSWERVPNIQIFFDDKLVIEGKATAFTNGALESALIHSRALLEFLGLQLKRGTKDKLAERKKKQPDDINIENFPALKKVSISQVLKDCSPPEEAEAAFAYVIYLANKGLAHTTLFELHQRNLVLTEIAFRGIPWLMDNNFYNPLSIEPPSSPVTSRKREVT